jgi:hypothetical protein
MFSVRTKLQRVEELTQNIKRTLMISDNHTSALLAQMVGPSQLPFQAQNGGNVTTKMTCSAVKEGKNCLNYIRQAIFL